MVLIIYRFESFLHYRHFHQVRRPSIHEAAPEDDGFPYALPPSSSARLANLPPGFAELFRTLAVDKQVFDLVENVSQWNEQLAEATDIGKQREVLQHTSAAMTLASYRAFDLLQQNKLGPAERLFVLGLLSYCIFMNNQQVYSVMEWALRLHCMAQVTTHMEPIEQDACGSMAWAAAVLMATGGDGSPQCHLGRRICRGYCGARSSLLAVAQVSKRYIWNADLTERLTDAGFDRLGRELFGDTA